MNLRRLLRHLFTPPSRVRRRFPQRVLGEIERRIAANEALHGGELRFALEGYLAPAELLRDVTPRERALELFSHLRVWDTELNNGVLIYVLLADHAVEIVADRGYAADAGAVAAWERACHTMEADFARNKYEEGVLDGIAEVSRLIAVKFPSADRNELPDQPIVL